jgi:membrane-bound serine protease (ClpP class)
VIQSIGFTMAGFVLMVAEVLFPSLGLFGLMSVAAIVFADVIALREVGQTFFWVLVGVQVVAIPLILKGAFWALPRLPFARGMVLEAPAADTNAGVPPVAHLVGVVGVALTDLRPSGTASLGDERRTVAAETGTIDAGTRVRVVAVEGYRIVVRPEA